MLTLTRRGVHARAAAILISSLVAFGAATVPAQANRLGPPWMSTVSVDQTTLYAAADRSTPVGPLPRGAVVVVIGTDSDMTHTPDGWVPSSDIVEDYQPWVAEVADANIQLYAKPDGRSDVLRNARQGDLVRVAGVSPGVDGDPNLWWATTEGYVGLHSIRSTANGSAQQWTLPAADDARQGWWGTAKAANVHAAPSTEAPLVGEFAGGERVKVLSEESGDDVNGNSTWYRIDGGRFAGAHVHSSLVERVPNPTPTLAPPDREVGHDPWIVVDRAATTLTLLRDGVPQFTTYVSLGKAGMDTPAGTYSTFIKYQADRMTSTTVPDAEHSYDLPNVPFAQYFKDDSSAIHGTYWHDSFGTAQSQGCVNVTWSDGAYLFGQTTPQIPSDQIGFAIDPAHATPVVIVN